MLFKLLNIQEQTATETLRCDGMGMYFDVCDMLRKDQKEKWWRFDFGDMCSIFKARFGKIISGDTFMMYEFVDTETGEQLELCCLTGVDLVCRKHEIYPEYILREIKEYYINNF